MKVNKIAVFAGIVMALSAGAAQALQVQTTVAISAQVVPAPTGCTVELIPSLNFPQVALGTTPSVGMPVVTGCVAGTPYSFTFSSVNGSAAGSAAGRLESATCALTYSVVAMSATGVPGIVYPLNAIVASATATAATQITRFGLKVDANQPGCVLQAGGLASVTDSLIVSVNY
jgi:type 1 fimbria pilin